MEGDEFFDEDLPAARELADSTPTAELFIYPGDQHLFTDSSLDAYDSEASALLLERVRKFLAAV
jgi:dienelactone hydrolase